MCICFSPRWAVCRHIAGFWVVFIVYSYFVAIQIELGCADIRRVAAVAAPETGVDNFGAFDRGAAARIGTMPSFMAIFAIYVFGLCVAFGGQMTIPTTPVAFLNN